MPLNSPFPLSLPVAVLALSTAVAVGLAPAATGATIGVTPARVLTAGSALSAPAIAGDGTIYSSTGSDIQVWAPSSDETPTVVKTFTGANAGTLLSLSETAGLAFVRSSTDSVVVVDPAQADGAAVATRTITGALTQLEDPVAVTWTSTGALWVVDAEVAGNPRYELLRFAPGADGNVAPVRQISGPQTKLGVPASSGLGTPTITGLPGDGVAVAPAGVEPQFASFSGTQSGNVAPVRRVTVPTPTPHWLSQGVGSDAQGRVYIASGDVDGNAFGRLDVYAPTANGSATPLVTLGGTQQRFQIPLLPSVSGNGRIALLDATILSLGGGGGITDADVKVFDPLFLKPGAPQALSITKSARAVTVRWKTPANASRTPLSYRVVVKKGTRTLVSRSVNGLALALNRRTLPTGTLKVTVSAVNLGGTGPGASKSFRR